MTSIVASAELIGFDGSRSIYRVDLSQLPFSTLQAISLVDDGVRSGGTGGSSGADIDFVAISDLVPPSTHDFQSVLADSKVLGADVVFHAGYLAQWVLGDLGPWDSSHLFGTVPGNVYDPAIATLGLADGDANGSKGTLSLGEAGQVSLLLNSPVPTGAGSPAQHYLYFADYGSRGQYADTVKVVLSDERAALPWSGGLTLTGDERSETIALGRGSNAHTGQGNDLVSGLGGHDTILTAGGDDWLFGGEGNDRLSGEAGRDRLSGEGGQDWLSGGAGNDWLHGGGGGDIFVFDTRLGTSRTDRKVAFDTIADFNVKDDTIWLDNAVFRKLGKGSELSPGRLNKAYFEIGKADDRNDYLLYDKKTGILSYDADGSGSKAAVEFAKLGKNLKLTHKDFFVI
ncbi:calcium-binding protein [Microvirga terrae]|uniref:calcium-binding protein n=2 Tax=Microvirga TaxID=186650 RepID=UPI002559A95C|nr:calcium-binding protein [Microvirga terrae]